MPSMATVIGPIIMANGGGLVSGVAYRLHLIAPGLFFSSQDAQRSISPAFPNKSFAVTNTAEQERRRLSAESGRNY
jgi:hypothetical protein